MEISCIAQTTSPISYMFTVVVCPYLQVRAQIVIVIVIFVHTCSIHIYFLKFSLVTVYWHHVGCPSPTCHSRHAYNRPHPSPPPHPPPPPSMVDTLKKASSNMYIVCHSPSISVFSFSTYSSKTQTSLNVL